MPLVKIHLRKGKSEEYVRLVSEAIHEALVTEASIPPDDKFHVVHQTEPAELIANPSYAEVNRSADLIVVEITLNAGRTVEIKRNIYRRMSRNLERAIQLRPDDLLVSLVEVTKENWSFGRGIATYAAE
ncbi:MAG: tautomerase family protein [Thermoanaerobaculia bacterium]|nr:tautomerase family protein [Thermoanaerobaculia bacterium]